LVLRGEAREREIELKGSPVSIGRGPQNDLVLEDPGKSVSRFHAEILFQDQQYVLVDRGSQNGVWVAGRRVQSIVLDPKVVATIGLFRLVFEGDAEPEAVPIEPTLTRPAQNAASSNPEGSAAPQVLRTGKTRQKARYQKWASVGIAAIALIIAIAAAVTYLSPRPPDATPQEIGRDIGLADPPPPPPAPLREVPDDSELIIASVGPWIDEKRDCSAAIVNLQEVLERDPGNTRALDLLERARGCMPQETSPKPTAKAPVEALVALPPEKGGLDPRSGETQAQYQARVHDAETRYNDALELLKQGNLGDAIKALESLRSIVPAGYRELDAKLAEARNARRDTARRARNSAADFEKKGDYDASIEALNRAFILEPDPEIKADIDRLTRQKIQAGLDACESGRKAWAVQFYEQARVHYERVLKFLPREHPCYETATQRVQTTNR
jgi:hypothetical protein